MVLFCGVLIGRNYDWAEFYSARAIEVFELLASIALVMVASYYLVERTSKQARRRDVFYDLLNRFSSDLDEMVTISIGFFDSREESVVPSLLARLASLVQLSRVISKHADEFVPHSFASGFNSDIQHLREAIGGSPFAEAHITFPDNWRDHVYAIRREIDRRIYQYRLDLFR